MLVIVFALLTRVECQEGLTHYPTSNNLRNPSEETATDPSLLPTITPGPCPNHPIANDFQVDKYVGRWYEIEKYPAPFQTGDCVTADYNLDSSCAISVANTEVVRGQLRTVFGRAATAGNPSVASLVVTFEKEPQVMNTNDANYNVVATDYENYAIVYSCSQFMNKKIEFSWILGRTPELDQRFLTNLKKWLVTLGINPARYIPTNQRHCQRRPTHI